MPDRILAALCQHLDRHAALINAQGILLKFMELHRFRMDQRIVKCEIFILFHRAVEIILTAAPAVARRIERTVHRDAFACDDRRRRIIEIQRFARERRNRRMQRVGGQRPCRDDDIPFRDFRDLAGHQCDIRMRTDLLCDKRRKLVPVNRERAARFDGSFLGAGHEQRPEPAHFLLQQACRGVHTRCFQRV